MKHQIMFSLICLSTLFLNNVFAATTCEGTSYASDKYTKDNRFSWGYTCSYDFDTDNKITLHKTPHSDSDESCKNKNLSNETLSVCAANNCDYYYNDQHPPYNIRNHGWFTAPNPYDNTEDDTDDICYTAYFYHKESSSPILSNHPSYNKRNLGVGTLSNYNTTNYKYSGILSETKIYNLTGGYDIETLFDNKFDLPFIDTTVYGTYNPVYKTKKIALIFSDFDVNGGNSIKAQCKNNKQKCEMVICDFGNLADCVAPTITAVVGNQGAVEVNGVTYITKDGKTLFATKFVTSPETENNTKKGYEIIAGEPIPLDILKAIMDGILEKYNKIDITTYRLTDFTIDWQECQENHYCDENGQHECPYGMKSEAGSGYITDCYIDEDTQLCDSAGCFPLEEGTRAYYTKGSD